MELIKKTIGQVMGGDYYSKFTWEHDKTVTEEDKELNAQALSEDDRVLDLLIIMDCTGSMSSWIELSKRTLTSCINSVREENSELDIRAAFVGYRDFCDTKTIFAIHDFTMDVDAVTAFIAKQAATGGGDAPEDVQGALQQGLDLNWRENSLKMCYFCADAPAHGTQYHDFNGGDNHPKGNPGGLVLEDLMQEFSDREIDFTVYVLTLQTDKMYNIMEQAYNQGKNAKEFKKIDLRDDIKQARAQGESLVAPKGRMETSYGVATSMDAQVRTFKQKAKRGWK